MSKKNFLISFAQSVKEREIERKKLEPELKKKAEEKIMQKILEDTIKERRRLAFIDRQKEFRKEQSIEYQQQLKAETERKEKEDDARRKISNLRNVKRKKRKEAKI